jgi:hypothetical protein
MTIGALSADPVLTDTRLGIARGLTYGLHDEPGVFLPQVRALGASCVRVYLYWSQIEPEPGRFVWDAVDALLAQVDDGDELWVTVYSTSTWATRYPNRLLPSSPALDPARYRRFVSALVRRGRGRVRFWQCDNEPNVDLLWSGSAADYVDHLRIFAGAVRAADPAALVVVGGTPPDALPVPGLIVDDEAIAFFDEILRDGCAYFDVLDVHPYGDPYQIPTVVDTAHRILAGLGHPKPIVIGEYNGPFPFELPALTARLSGLLAGVSDDEGPDADPDSWALTGERAMVALYRRMPALPPLLQMFMVGCPPELEARRHRWNCRDLVVRNLVTLSAGVRRTICWQLAPDRPGPRNPYRIMELLFGKFSLMDYEGDEIARRYPAADTLALLNDRLAGVAAVNRLAVPGQPDVHAFAVDRPGRGPLLVVWERRDDLTGEDGPAVPFRWPWPAPAARAVDAFGAAVPVEVRDGHVHLGISLTPVFVDGPG